MYPCTFKRSSWVLTDIIHNGSCSVPNSADEVLTDHNGSPLNEVPTSTHDYWSGLPGSAKNLSRTLPRIGIPAAMLSSEPANVRRR